MDFYQILREAHSGWRYLVILVGLVFLIKMLAGWFTNGRWSTLDRRLGTVTTIVVDIQVLLGLVLWIMTSAWAGTLGTVRSYEHPFIMLLATAIAHIGWTRAKRSEADAAKYRVASIFFLIAAILAAVGIARVTGVM